MTGGWWAGRASENARGKNDLLRSRSEGREGMGA